MDSCFAKIPLKGHTALKTAKLLRYLTRNSIQGWKKFRKNSFYLITTQLMCCDVCALLLDLYAAFPITLLGVQASGYNELTYLSTSLENLKEV